MAKQRKCWIFAYLYSDKYVAEEVIDSPEHRLANLEYADVKKNEYQLWEYPSGKIFSIQPDRGLDPNENQYATPYGASGTVWQPRLVEIGIETDKVEQAYRDLAKD
ncbi:MAG TPA: hypothetical protein VD735_04430 [Candidatus Saccharimonadales bacterium]|nr:hypothetical protein [Candidatus Saccharimonadales bacterium]